MKDTTSLYWQTVLAGARKAGQDLNVGVPELGAQSESDINGQISILENAVSGNPAAIVIAPTQFAALGKPIDQAAKTADSVRSISQENEIPMAFPACRWVQVEPAKKVVTQKVGRKMDRIGNAHDRPGGHSF